MRFQYTIVQQVHETLIQENHISIFPFIWVGMKRGIETCLGQSHWGQEVAEFAKQIFSFIWDVWRDGVCGYH